MVLLRMEGHHCHLGVQSWETGAWVFEGEMEMEFASRELMVEVHGGMIGMSLGDEVEDFRAKAWLVQSLHLQI